MKSLGSILFLLLASCIPTRNSEYYAQQAQNQIPYEQDYRDPSTIISTMPSRSYIWK
jgi:hypothetical protein